MLAAYRYQSRDEIAYLLVCARISANLARVSGGMVSVG